MIFGIDYLGGANYGNVIINEHPAGWAAGFILNTNEPSWPKRNAWPVIESLARTGRCPLIRVHAIWDDAHTYRPEYLPIINRVVNEKLAELGFFAKFTMDENFDETIMYNGVTERVFNQFSEGQKLRINIALILAWREIARLQGRMSSNLLMFDETLDVSLDDDGYESLTEIFNRMDNLNIFVISQNVS